MLDSVISIPISSWERMAFAARCYSKGRIDRAGKDLVSPEVLADSPIWEESQAVINNWRACHSYPLQIIKMALLNRARQVNENALVAQRLKRFPSIYIKLRDNPNMKLSQMQDIGGCRAIMSSVHEVDQLVAAYTKAEAKNPHGRPLIDNFDDYIEAPKPDGYRSVHLIYRYQSKAPAKAIFNGQRIEVQIRSRLQHAWATAVEIAQTFTGQALKSRVKDAKESWLRFFALMGSAIAIREKRPPVPGTPHEKAQLTQELRDLENQEQIISCLSGWGAAIERVQRKSEKAHTFLLELDPLQHTLNIASYKRNEFLEAEERYSKREKETGTDSPIQIVLVAADSIGALRKAYPNYFVDTTVFIEAIRNAMGTGQVRK